jgi:hypothetical protein
MKITLIIQHDLDPELSDYLEKLDTFSHLEVCGRTAFLSVDDPETINLDIRKIAKKVNEINAIYRQLGYPWAAREVLDGNAWLANGNLVYKPGRRGTHFRNELESKVGPLSDAQYKEILQMATVDIVANRIDFSKITTLADSIKIAAQCAEALRKCGR